MSAQSFERRLSARAALRVEVFDRDRKTIVAVSRLKLTPGGSKRTGQALELAGHHLADLITVLEKASHELSVKSGQQHDDT